VYIDYNDALTSLTGLDNITSVTWHMHIHNNALLTDLSSLSNINYVGGNLKIYYNDVLTNLCALYNVHLPAGDLEIYSNTSLSMDTAYALKTYLIINNGFNNSTYINSNHGSVDVFCDNDNDTVYDHTDNCPNVCNPSQLDADSDGTGDSCDTTAGCGGCGQPACEVSCDADCDGISILIDNCPDTCNIEQLDADNDGTGDVCDDTPGCGGCGEPVCEVVCWWMP
jgi:hypothetical protein